MPQFILFTNKIGKNWHIGKKGTFHLKYPLVPVKQLQIYITVVDCQCVVPFTILCYVLKTFLP